MPILRMTHIGICVTDLARATAFYRDGLGFQPRAEFHVSGPPSTTLLRLAEVDLQAVYLERDGTRIAWSRSEMTNRLSTLSDSSSR